MLFDSTLNCVGEILRVPLAGQLNIGLYSVAYVATPKSRRDALRCSLCSYDTEKDQGRGGITSNLDPFSTR